MVKTLKRFLVAIIVIILLLGGVLWWLLSYIAPNEKLDMSYVPIDVKEKALAMVRKLKPELALTEDDINHLIKMNMKRELDAEEAGRPALELKKGMRLDGAVFELEENKLIARMNVTYKDRIPAELNASYSLEWQSPNIVLRPQALSLKKIALPLSMLDTIIIPLDLPAQDILTVRDVVFEDDQVLIRFKLSLQLKL